MIKFKILFLSLFLGTILPVSSAIAIEVSEVTVDFPLSEVLNIKAPESDTEVQVSEGGKQVNAWRPPWEDDWYAYRQNVLRGNFSEADKKLEKVIKYRKERGVPNLFDPAAALLVEASSARNQGRYEDALDMIAYAGELAPDDPEPHFQRARTIWRQNQLRALSSLDALLQGWGTFFKDFRSYFPWGIGIVLWILIAMTISSLLTILLFTTRVMPRIAHDLSHVIKVPQWLWLAGILTALFTAVILGLPVVIWVLLVALTMLLHLTGRERVAVGLALLFMTALPLLVHLLSKPVVLLSFGSLTDRRPRLAR